LSRASAIAFLPVAVTALRSGQALWFFLALLALCAFESNRYRLSSIVRLLSVVAQLGAVFGLFLLGLTVAFYAESGRQAPFLGGVIILIFLGIVLMALGAVVGAIGTLKTAVAEP
jgi:hypothetical protein